MLQRQRGHPHKPIGTGSHRGRDFLILQLNQVAGERAVRRVAPGVDVDRLIVDALLVHVLQARRGTGAKRNRARQIIFGRHGQRGVFHQVPAQTCGRERRRP